MASTVYLGRQPVLDRQRRTYGYELLFRQGRENAAFFDDPDDATRCLVERTLLEWGIEHVLHGRVGFVNVGAGFLISGTYHLLPSDHMVLELLEDVDYDERVIKVILEAHAAGYRFALDDITHAEQVPDPVMSIVDIVKVDVLQVDRTRLPELVSRLRVRAPRAHLLAEKVEEIEDFEECTKLGFDLFQGYFFAKPELLSRTARPVNSSAALALLVEMQRPLIDITKMEELVTGDPTLAFRLLALVNSSHAGLTQRVNSVHHAIVLLGIEHVRQLATLLTMASSVHTNQEIVVLAATRARMARLLAPKGAESSAFTVGLLSVIDTIFRAPMADLIRELPLSVEIADALLGRGGRLGVLLDTIRAYEVADIDKLDVLWPDGIEALRIAFGDAATWADGFRRQIVAA